MPEGISEVQLFYRSCPPGYHVDHIIPLSEGGTHTRDNLQYITNAANRMKIEQLHQDKQGS